MDIEENLKKIKKEENDIVTTVKYATVKQQSNLKPTEITFTSKEPIKTVVDNIRNKIAGFTILPIKEMISDGEKVSGIALGPELNRIMTLLFTILSDRLLNQSLSISFKYEKIGAYSNGNPIWNFKAILEAKNNESLNKDIQNILQSFKYFVAKSNTAIELKNCEIVEFTKPYPMSNRNGNVSDKIDVLIKMPFSKDIQYQFVSMTPLQAFQLQNAIMKERKQHMSDLTFNINVWYEYLPQKKITKEYFKVALALPENSKTILDTFNEAYYKTTIENTNHYIAGKFLGYSLDNHTKNVNNTEQKDIFLINKDGNYEVAKLDINVYSAIVNAFEKEGIIKKYSDIKICVTDEHNIKKLQVLAGEKKIYEGELPKKQAQGGSVKELTSEFQQFGLGQSTQQIPQDPASSNNHSYFQNPPFVQQPNQLPLNGHSQFNQNVAFFGPGGQPPLPPGDPRFYTPGNPGVMPPNYMPVSGIPFFAQQGGYPQQLNYQQYPGMPEQLYGQQFRGVPKPGFRGPGQ